MKMLFISTVNTFFKQRAGMFFVILGVVFGFMSSREHYSFAIFFLTDAFGMYYLFGIWLVYTLMCCQFVSRLWARPEYVFIYQSRLWSFPLRAYRFGVMSLGFAQPIIFYGLYLITIAKQNKLLMRVSPIFFFYLVLCLFLIIVAEWRIRHPYTFVAKSRTVVKWPFARPVSWIYWSLEWLLREKGVTLLVCKIGATGVVIGTLLYYSTDVYDIRLPAIGMSLGFLLNIGLSYELYQWESQVWLWNRSLPLTVFARFGRILALHAIIILPETLIALRQDILPIIELIQIYGLGLALLVLFHVYLYKQNGLLEEMMQLILFGFILLTLLILYHTPVFLLATMALAFSYYKFPKWYAV